MKLIVTRLGIPRPKKPKRGAFHSRRRKIMTALLGTALTLGVCLAAEMIPRRDAVPTLTAVGEGGVSLPVILYPQILPDGEKGENKNASSVSLLEEDLDWLAENGYETVSCSQVIDYARGMGKLPERPVLLTFDGSWQSICGSVLPLLTERDQKGLAVIIGSDADLYSASVPKKPGEARLSWNEIRKLDQSPNLELANGTYDLRSKKGPNGRKGISPLRNESFSAYRAFIGDDLLTLQNRMNEELSHDAAVFCYPLGEKTDESEAVLKDLGFLMTLCEGKKIAVIRDGESLFGISCISRSPDKEAKVFFEKLGLGN